MLTTDQVFRINREERQGLQRRKPRWGCAVVCVLVLAAAVALALTFSESLRAYCARAVPWLQSKGRVVVGKMSLIPAQAIIDRSGITSEQKLAAKNLLDNSWKTAKESQDAVYRREDIINLARQIVESRAGLYYALGILQDRGVDGTGLNALQRKMAGRLFKETMADMESGKVGLDRLGGFKKEVHLLVLEAKTGFVGPEEKEEADARLRSLLTELSEINKSRSQLPMGEPVDMTKELLSEMRRFRKGLEESKAREE